MKKLKLAILRNEVDDDHIHWVKSCEEKKQFIDWKIIDISRFDWFEQVLSGSFDGLLAIPGGYTTHFRTLYDERITILNAYCGIPVFPTLGEILIFENKRFLSYWLKAKNISHPKTWIFYFQNEALNFLKTAAFPLVAKTNIGAGGSGVKILNTQIEVKDYILKAFSGKGIGHKSGPRWTKRGFIIRVIKKLLRPSELRLKLSKYRILKSDRQSHFIIFQEFVPHSFEWRCVRIGDSYFAHKKMVVGNKASGSLVKSYEIPPFELLNLVKKITDQNGFFSQAIDIFVSPDGSYLVNEMQCIFGQSDPYQMLIEGQPGRYYFQNGQWIFQPGDFNRYESYLLRLETFIDILKKKNNL